MKNWRPDKKLWDKARADVFGDIAIHTTHEDYLFEAGADAMLEALKKIGSRVDGRESLDIKGWRIFIPEEAKE